MYIRMYVCVCVRERVCVSECVREHIHIQIYIGCIYNIYNIHTPRLPHGRWHKRTSALADGMRCSATAVPAGPAALCRRKRSWQRGGPAPAGAGRRQPEGRGACRE